MTWFRSNVVVSGSASVLANREGRRRSRSESPVGCARGVLLGAVAGGGCFEEPSRSEEVR